MNIGEFTGWILKFWAILTEFGYFSANFRLLDLLAFKPKFIRALWYTLLTSKTDNDQLSISILSRGITIRKLTLCAIFISFFE